MISRRSSTATRRFRCARSKATDAPMIPPPTITTSYVFTPISYQQCGWNADFATFGNGPNWKLNPIARDLSKSGHAACVRGNSPANLKRFHEFGGKHARFFGEILRADP